jgi:hypothetical protein
MLRFFQPLGFEQGTVNRPIIASLGLCHGNKLPDRHILPDAWYSFPSCKLTICQVSHKSIRFRFR